MIASAVIPLWKLGTHHGLTAPQRTWLCAALLLYPALAGGTSYDLHENCFLTPLILWLFLGIDRKNIPLTLLSALLVLSVKEDAAVYVAIIGLWLIVRALLHRVSRHRQDLLMGCLLFVISLICFLLVTGYLHRIGDGVMTGRYQNLMPEGEDSLLAVVRTALTNPMKVLFECADREKLEYIALTMLPLLGLPLLTRRYERYLLLFPWILVNLMPDYLYQHSIFFQYSFGSLAFLFYLTAVNLADLRSSRRTLSLLALTAVSAASFAFTVLPKAVGYVSEYTQNRAHYQEVYNCLATIPEDASVTATTFYTTPLSRREELYDLGYTSKEQLLQTEYIVVDPGLEGEFSRYTKPGQENGFSNLAALLLRDGYREYARVGHVLIIFARDP